MTNYYKCDRTKENQNIWGNCQYLEKITKDNCLSPNLSCPLKTIFSTRYKNKKEIDALIKKDKKDKISEIKNIRTHSKNPIFSIQLED